MEDRRLPLPWRGCARGRCLRMGVGVGVGVLGPRRSIGCRHRRGMATAFFRWSAKGRGNRGAGWGRSYWSGAGMEIPPGTTIHGFTSTVPAAGRYLARDFHTTLSFPPPRSGQQHIRRLQTYHKEQNSENTWTLSGSLGQKPLLYDIPLPELTKLVN